MATSRAVAPGKVILFGEHAVVYGRPAIAVPVHQKQASAVVSNAVTPGIELLAPDLLLAYKVADAPANDPLVTAVRLVQQTLGVDSLPDLTITVRSSIPIASGLGSGAAIAAALIRALLIHLGDPAEATPALVSRLTYEVEKLHHGTPSGIDNSVVAYERPIYFVRRQPENLILPLTVGHPLHLIIADTGVASPTWVAVSDVRYHWEADRDHFEQLFTACGTIAESARACIELGEMAWLGQLMNENHRLLQQMTVSAPELDRLVTAARKAGALGAKLSGAGRGGNMVALVDKGGSWAVRQALLAAGAQQVIETVVAQDNQPDPAGEGQCKPS
jgi:mevalonate kinase